ncbi:hypothetical protein EOW65_05520 [Sinirhodobacter ferrireducens]|uniref:Uncharacterized protein n=1 Tax=Paenirhodobacter ferrireducens TaxID=1215032 RepID=A0A443LPE4_9RHOB|nr:hypothetical protein [Sinirhodobacter ferrireducens]RWR51015.1 hypothetical protein EOW65_05520 [Sinirhodobacter ferrireducens]
MIVLLLLFFALGATLALLTWAELSSGRRDTPPPSAGAPTPAGPAPADAPKTGARETGLARITAGAADPEAEDGPPDAALTHVRGFAPGDLLELELDIPAPAAEQIRFEQAGPHARVLIAGAPVLLIEDTEAASLTPAIFRFRSNA